METTTDIYTVSQLNAEARLAIENTFRKIWVMGEISNLSRPSSGHLYFSLKDTAAQIRCALFRSAARQLAFTPENGQQVLLSAGVSLYEARGDFQLIVSSMQLAGDGALQVAFEKLKKRLAAEGLFNPEHKKPLPTLPQKIGVITSPSGAAIRDILTVLARRMPMIPVIIYPSMVQGQEASTQLVDAIQIANNRQECDVLIVSRGGGSLEDLWPFNEEAVARAIYASHIPIIAGVGHEVDFTIADFAADQRAATPSAAAERVSPDRATYLHHIDTLHRRLQQITALKLQKFDTQLHHLKKRLRHPGQQLREQAQRLDQLEQRLTLAQKNALLHWQQQLQQSTVQFHHAHPQQKIERLQEKMMLAKEKLITSMQLQLKHSQQQITHLARALDAVSPLQTLQRGYAVLTHKTDNKLINSVNLLAPGDKITAKLQDGDADLTVSQVYNSDIP